MNDIIKNFIWRLLERFGAQGVTFLVSIILARLLDPSVYGIVALVSIFTTIISVFIDSGFGNALIQKKDADDLDFSSVFYFNVIICLFLYIILFLLSPIIANYYGINDLSLIIRVSGLGIIISGIKNIQIAYVSRYLLFKKFFYSTLGGTLISAIVGILLAYKGFGAWALVIQGLTNNFIDTIILWFTVKWKPKFVFSFKRLKILFTYGWKLLASALLDTTYNQLRQLIIGKKYTSSDLAYYNKGNHFPSSATISIVTSIDSILFPVMSKEQDSISFVRNMTRKSIKIASYVLWPMMIGLAACSDNLIRLLLTEKWMPTVPYLRIFCITYAFYPIHTSNLNAIKALGRSDIFLKLEIIKKVYGLIIILISMRYGVYVMALSTILSSIISQIVNSYPNKELMNYRYIDQLKDLAPSAILSIIMGIIVYCVNYIGLNTILTLIIQVVSGIIIYVGLSIITKNDSFTYCLNTIKLFRNRKNNK